MGGQGERFGAPKPKQFIEAEFEGVPRPLFEITALKLLRALPIDIAIFVSPKNIGGAKVLAPFLDKFKAEFPDRKMAYAQAGGTRFTSFLSGLNALRKWQGIERIVVHDANRPYLSREYLQRVSSHMGYLSKDVPCFVPVVPVVDSTVRLDAKNVLSYENRDELRRVQTPQLIHAETFIHAQGVALSQGRMAFDFTDEGSMCLSLGLRVGTFEGDLENVKITYPTDLMPEKL